MRRWQRPALLLVAAGQAQVGVWGELSPHSFFTTFPGFGHHWVAMFGTYNEHLVRDYAAAELGFALLLVLAAVWFERRVVLVAGAAFLAGTLPHFIYHLTTTSMMSTGDNVASLGAFAAEIVAVAAVMFTVAGTPSPPHKEIREMARLEPRRPRGLDLFRRATYRYGKQTYGTEMAPSTIIAHSKSALFGYGMIGMAHQRGKAVPQRYKSIAMLRVAQLTGCEWCLDFGSKLAQDSGVPSDDLKELALWRRSARFGELDKLVLEYAEAMTRTPVAVTDEQFASLREHFDEAQMVELTMAIAAENLFCRTNWALGIEGEGFSDGMYCVVPDAQPAAVPRPATAQTPVTA